MSCTTSCGTIGTARCVGGTFGACAPPLESCNGADDDCDGMVDDGFECGRGASMSCTTACGTAGTRTCRSDCSGFGACTAAEACNGCDDDADGTIDEGFRAVTLSARYSVDLVARHPGCDGTSQRIGPDCNAAIHRFCAARGCTTTGFGPVENFGDNADIACVVGHVVVTSYTELSRHHGGCTATRRYGPDCNAAIHRFCASRGQTTGFGPVENSGDTAVVSCVRDAMVVGTTYTTLRGHHPDCDGARERMGPACNAAIHRFCASRGFESGFGPVENFGDNADIACVRR
jgi:hypothetical protein